MNGDLISRSELLKHGFFIECEDGFYASVVKSVDIRHAPAVDAVEVVRCKDCRYCFDGVCLHPKTRIAMKVPDFGKHYVYMADLKVTEDHFCSYGERRGDNG